MRDIPGGVCLEMSSTCVQGGIPRPLGGYQANVMMEAHSPAPAWHMHHPAIPKQEPMEEERNDSGINSGSDFHSSSPGSDNSQDYNPAYSSPTVPHTPVSYYTTPVTSQYHQPRMSTNTSPYHLGFNPLTPPSSEPMISPKSKPDQSTTLTPHASPTNSDSKTLSTDEMRHEDDPLRKLQMTFEKNAYLPSVLSPKTTSEHSNDDDNKSDLGDEFDEDGHKIPKVNSHGKVKQFKCKQCDFVAITKLDFWEHSKGHIKTDKLLTCPKCPFVTEYKHHLEYHLRNHFGSKPFKCDKCNYSCVNKSMLNSHLKSHSNVYQYRCSECSYATKYCHSLKLHLRKYNHKPAMVLNPDGTPNPLPIIDVYGTRRGPKQKMHSQKDDNEMQQQQQQHPFAQFMLGANPQLSLPFPYPFIGGFPGAHPLLFPQMTQQINDDKEESQPPAHQSSPSPPAFSPPPRSPSPISPCALDLSKPDAAFEAPPKNRRKGRAFKLDRSILQQKEACIENMDSESKEAPVKEVKEENPSDDYVCQFCCIAFGDPVLYTMHMGYHALKDPFKCNMCGEQCKDKVSFFLHIARNPHT